MAKPPKPIAASASMPASEDASPAFVPPGSAAPPADPLAEAAEIAALAEELGTTAEEVFAVNLSTGVIVTRDGRKLRRGA